MCSCYIACPFLGLFWPLFDLKTIFFTKWPFLWWPSQERDTQLRSSNSGKPKCHFFSTFFLNKLYKDSGEYDYSKVGTALFT